MEINQKNYAFIDTNNLYLAIKRLGWKIDWFKFRKYLKDKYNIERAFIFIGKIKKYQSIYDIFRKAGFEIIFREIVVNKNIGEIKGNVDAEMIMWTMHYLYDVQEHFDKAILITGDGDFACLAQYLDEKNKLLFIGIPNKNRYSSLLKTFSIKKMFFISELKDKIEIKNTPKWRA
jgi:uncharacterized LabA/DUF88 family protein